MTCPYCHPIVKTINVEPDNTRCSQRCGRCSKCIRAEAVERNTAQWGTTDYPGVEGERESGVQAVAS